uniref:Uncharacterized protein n=1 Tax=Arion vulgaris TaxID=1028688 RepID=A0A0B6XZW1_9EUPU
MQTLVCRNIRNGRKAHILDAQESTCQKSLHLQALKAMCGAEEKRKKEETQKSLTFTSAAELQ